jgi:hypothetical protein
MYSCEPNHPVFLLARRLYWLRTRRPVSERFRSPVRHVRSPLLSCRQINTHEIYSRTSFLSFVCFTSTEIIVIAQQCPHQWIRKQTDSIGEHFSYLSSRRPLTTDIRSLSPCVSSATLLASSIFPI